MDSKISMVVNMKSLFSLQNGSQFSLPCLNNFFPVRNLSCFPLPSLSSKPPKFVRLKASTTLTGDEQESNRTFEKLVPSPWTDHFHSVFVDVSEMDALRKEIEVLKTKVKNAIFSSQGIDSTKERILMIYLLESLGLAHYFEEEICETIKEGLEKIEEMMAGEVDLYTVSIIFWVFRTYGQYISSDVFRRFKGIDGNFKESLKEDAKGMLSLYEAAHLHTPKDHILDEALSFTSRHLESLAEDGMCPPHLSMRIRNALTISQRWNMEIISAMEYIFSYEQEEGHDETLLRFAKLSFKLLQLQYLQDLKILTKWYKEKEFESKFPPYFKDRIVENYFYVLAVYFEPQVSPARILCTKNYTIYGILDDTCDRYASLPEVESLAKSLERWVPDDTMNEQPCYLSFVLKFVLETFQEFEREHMLEGKPYCVKANIEEIKELVKAHFQLLKWVHAGYVPSFEEYMEVGEVESVTYGTLACFIMCMGKMATKEDYKWLESRPKLAKSLATKLRLANDIYGFEGDMSRGYITTAVNCYMKQYRVTEEEAVKELLKMGADLDKTINEELLTSTGVSRLFIKAALRLAKMTALCYNGYEGFTHPEGKIKEYMTSIFVDLIRL